MARDPDILVDGLVAVGNAADEEDARDGWADAFTTYFYDATANGVPVTPGSLLAARNAMDGALMGMSALGAAPALIQTAITLFWTTIVGTPSAVFLGATLITPPVTLSLIAADILVATPINQAAESDAETALGFVVNGILDEPNPPLSLGLHMLNEGATATFPGPIVAPIL